jgi:hypothetical protein
MCEKAKEIQDQEILLYPHQFFALKDSRYAASYGELHQLNNVDLSRSNLIWLPRQDQLQEMINWNYNLRFYGFKMIEGFDPSFDIEWQIIKKSNGIYLEVEELKKVLFFQSMEEILLLMIMQEKFHKKWDGEDWQSV